MKNEVESSNNSEEISQEVIDLVIARLDTIPSNVSLSIGGEGSFDVRQLIERVKLHDEIGRKIIEMQLSYIRSLQNLTMEDNVPFDH